MAKQAFDILTSEEQERIIRAVIDEFNSSGTEGADMAVIAGNAGISEQDLRQYFEDNCCMLKASLVWAITYIMEKMEKEVDINKMDVFEFLGQNLEERIEIFKGEDDLTLFLMNAAYGKFGVSFEDMVSSVWDLTEKYVRLLIANGQQRGTVRSDVDPYVLETFLLHPMLAFKKLYLKQAEEKGIMSINQDMLSLAKPLLDDFLKILKTGISA